MKIELQCTIADIDNAIRISGDGNGLRLVIDVADADVKSVVTQLVDMREETLLLELKTESYDDTHPGSEGAGGAASAGEPDPERIAKYRRSFV